MIRVAHLSDLHVTEGPRLEDQAEDLARIGTQIEALRPDLILLTGDYYGRTVPHRPTPRERAVLEPWLVRFADVAPVVVLEGNHDHGEALDLEKFLGGAYPIRVVRGAEYFTIHTEQGDVDIYGLAYPTKRWLVAQAGAIGLEASTDAVGAALRGILSAWAARIEARRRRNPQRPVIAAIHATIRGAVFSSGEVLSTSEIEIPQDLLTAMDVDYGALGHIHERQEMAPRWWYVGDPWAVDFGEHGEKGWHLVSFGQGFEMMPPSGPRRTVYNSVVRSGVSVDFASSGSRPWRTLDYRWAIDLEDGAGRWVTRPDKAAIAACRGCEVRARLVVPDQAVASCPWAAELEQLRAAGVHRLTDQRTIEPTQRVRAPAVAAAQDLAGKVKAYWDTLGTPLAEVEQDAALAALQELETLDDAQIGQLTRELIP